MVAMVIMYIVQQGHHDHHGQDDHHGRDNHHGRGQSRQTEQTN